MHGKQEESNSFESSFDINKLSFKNVSEEFENEFREAYKNSLEIMSDNKGPLENASGANSLALLEKMAQQLSFYDKNSDFEQSYYTLIKEYEPFTET